MAIDDDKWLDLYDERSDIVSRSKHQNFEQNLRRWFALLDEHPRVGRLVSRLEARKDFQSWYAEHRSTTGSGGQVHWPAIDDDRVGLQISLFRAFATESIRVMDFVVDFTYPRADIRAENNDFLVGGVIEQLFDPLFRELRRYARRSLVEPVEPLPDLVPASDRTVTIDHNSPDYLTVTRNLEALEEAVRGSNDYPDAEDKSQRVAELSAMRQLLSANRVRMDACLVLVSRGLQHFAKTFADNIIGALALAALAALGRLTGFW